MERYFQEDIETASVDQIKAMQKEKLIKQVAYVYKNNEYYRKKMQEKGVEPGDIKELEDVSKLPFLSKSDWPPEGDRARSTSRPAGTWPLPGQLSDRCALTGSSWLPRSNGVRGQSSETARSLSLPSCLLRGTWGWS